MTVTALARTLDQELIALARGASLACPVCGEFVLHVRGAHGLAIACPECRRSWPKATSAGDRAAAVAQNRLKPGQRRGSPSSRPRSHPSAPHRSALPS